MPSDVWSLGCILYLMIYRRTPYQHIMNTMKIQIAIRAGDPIKYDGIEDLNLLDCLQVRPHLALSFFHFKIRNLFMTKIYPANFI